ncbi:DUF2029 domain-containing protein [bacterium]|nr:DUF2029 domain-containing protein [bacterium]
MIHNIEKIINHRDIILIALIVLFIIYLSLFLLSDISKNKSDFANYYTASSMFSDGKNLSNIYDNRHLKRQANIYGIENTIVSYVPHTPPTLILYAPVTLLKPDAAKSLWSVLNLLFLIGSIYLLHRTYNIRFHIVLLLGLSFVTPVFNNILMGQAYLFILFMVSLGLFLWHKNRHLAAGVIIGLASSVKPFPLFMIIPAIMSRRWKIVTGMVIGFTIPHLVIYSISPEIYEPYFNLVLPATLSGEIQNPFHHGFRSYTVLLRNLFVHDPFRNQEPAFNSPFMFSFLRMFISLILIALFSFISSAMRNDKRVNDVDCASFFLMASMLVSPVTSSYQYVLLIPPFLVISRLLSIYVVFMFISIFTFLIFGYFYHIDYIELICIICVFAVILHYFRHSINRRYAGFAVISILLVSLVIPYSLSSDYSVNDKIEPVTGISTTGFPDELRVSKGIIYFSQISNGNYDINLARYAHQFPDDQFMPCYQYKKWDRRLVCLSSNSKSEFIRIMHGTKILTDNEFDLEKFQSIGYIVNLDYMFQETSSILAVSALADGEYKTHIQISSNGTLDEKVFNGVYATRIKSSGNIYCIEKGNEHCNIKRIDITDDGALFETLYQSPNHIRDFDVSAEEELISFTVEKDSGNTDIFVLNIDTKKLDRITYHPARDYSPAFYKKYISSSREYLYFISERGCGLNDGRFYRINVTDF